MAKLSWHAQYRNKYPGSVVHETKDSFQVVDGSSGELLVSVSKNGNDDWNCDSEEQGARHCHDLSPLPESARAWVLQPSGKIEKSEDHEEKLAAGRSLASKYGKVPSQLELKAYDKAEKKA